MVVRMVALLVDEAARRDMDLVRALYDREAVETTPPHLPLVPAFEERIASGDLADQVGLIAAVYQPFVLTLTRPQRFFDGEEHLLQLVTAKGADEAQRLAAALYRDVFPHHQPSDPAASLLRRSALTLGRFRTEQEAEKAVEQLGDKSYFLVMSQVAILEEEKREGRSRAGWSVQRTLPLGAMAGASL